MSRNLYGLWMSMDIYGWLKKVLFDISLSRDFNRCDHSPPTEQSVHVVEESAEQTTKHANEGKYKHLHKVIPCLFFGPETTDQELNSWSVTKWLGKKGNSVVKYAQIHKWQASLPV